MKFTELYESNGTFVGIKLSKVSADQLTVWCHDNNIKCESDFHVTLLYDENKEIPYIPEVSSIKINPETFEMAKLGSALVLKFSNDELSKKHHILRQKYNIDWDFNKFIPHITLVYTWHRTKPNIDSPKFPITLSQEYIEEFSKEDK